MIFKPLLNCSAASHNCGCDRRGSCAFLFLVVPTVRISFEIRTLLSNYSENRGKFCQKIIFRGFLANFQLWKFTLQLLPLHPPPDLRGQGVLLQYLFHVIIILSPSEILKHLCTTSNSLLLCFGWSCCRCCYRFLFCKSSIR